MTTKTAVKTRAVEVKREIYTSIETKDLEGLLTATSKRGTTFIKMFTETKPAMRKTNNPYLDNVVKNSQIVCMIGFDYENVVNNARVKEAFNLAIDYFAEQFEISNKEAQQYLESLMPKANSKVRDFRAKERIWGTHKNSIIIENTLKKTGEYKLYVQVWVLHSKKPVYKYIDDGKELTGNDLDEMKTFLLGKTSNAKHQGLDKENEVIIRDYDINNIDKIHLNKEKYAIRK